jgi:hypothetical protein
MRGTENRLVCGDRAAMVAAVRLFEMTALPASKLPPPKLTPPRAIHAG